MVDINLIGDEQTGEEKTREEERLEDFAQTSSMDTQELAFEERTETFDTTKTGAFPHRRSYSPFVSVLIIVIVIVFLGGVIYYFMFGDDSSEQTDLPQFIPESESVVESIPAESEQSTSSLETEPESELETAMQDEPPVDLGDTGSISRPSSGTREPINPISSQYLSNSVWSIQTVTDLLSSIPANLNCTLLSFAGQRLRMEFVSASASDARDFAANLNQNLGSGSFSILSESQVATNGRSFEKVLISGRIARKTQNIRGSVEAMDLDEFRNWVRTTGQQFGVQVRQINVQQGASADGYTRIPILMRIFGDKASLVAILEAIASQRLNVELTKILLVSPDMISYSDDQLMLVVNLFLYEAF